LLRDQFGVLGLHSSNTPQHHAVLGTRQVTHLPGNMTDPARRLSKPLGSWRLVEKSDGVVAGEDDLLDAKLQGGHDYFSFAGNFPTIFAPASIQSFNGSSPAPPSGSTSPQPFMGLPVMSNSLTCGSSSASSARSRPSRTQSESFQTPTSRLPLSRKPTPPNIFLSSTFLRRARRCRMRSARASSKAIGDSLLFGWLHSRLDRQCPLTLSLSPDHFRAFPRQPQIPVGRETVVSREVGLRRRAVRDLEDRRSFIDLIEHGDVDHLRTEVR